MLNLSVKGSSQLYIIMKDSSNHILENAADRWNDKTDMDVLSFDLSKSFNFHHHKYRDTYLKYIQFRTLHHRFYTNDLLFKMGIKNSNLCSFCLEKTDSNSHMLLVCNTSINLWDRVQIWIRELGMVSYNLSMDKIIMGNL